MIDIPLVAKMPYIHPILAATLVTTILAWTLNGVEQIYGMLGAIASVLLAVVAVVSWLDAPQESRSTSRELASIPWMPMTRGGDPEVRLQQVLAELRSVRRAWQQSETKFRVAFEQAPVGMAVVDAHNRLTDANPILCDMLGYPIDQLERRSITSFVLDEDIIGFADVVARTRCGSEPKSRTDVRFVGARGDTLWASVVMGVAKGETADGNCVVLQVQDISESVQLAARLQYESVHDELTGFVNRQEFERRLTRLVANHRRESETHTLCYLDIDHFRVVNDSEGYIAGDELLRQLARILRKHVGGHDTIARIGGDEFSILLENCGLSSASVLAETLVDEVAATRFRLNDKVVRLSISVGVAEIGHRHDNACDVWSAADTARMAAKELGGSRVQTYVSQQEELRCKQADLEWLSRLTEALESDGFELFAQPIAPTAGADAGLRLEVLLRMQGSDGECCPPAAFIAAAERYGLAARLDRWVLDAVFRWFTENPGAAAQVESCAINLSGSSLGDVDFADHVVRQVETAPLSPGQIRFEITETAAISRMNQAREFMTRIKGLGCRFSLDDFGSGLSSFGYLRSLPVDTLKIDGQFVRDIVHDNVDHSLVKAINEIGRVFGLATVAEHVEDESILESVREIGVKYVQGHHVGEPQPLERLFASVRQPAREAVHRVAAEPGP